MNSRLKRGLGFLALVAVVFGFGSLILGPSGSKPNRSYVLSDGSVLSLGPISYGLNRTIRQSNVTGWRKQVGQMLPFSWSAWLGWLPFGPAVTLWGDPGQSKLLVSTICRLGTNSTHLTPRLQIFDETGNVFDGVEGQGSLESVSVVQSTRMDVWSMAAFPRRGKELGLRIFSESNGVRQAMAEFTFPNPAQGDYPIWRPDPLPITRNAGELAITLVNFKSFSGERDPAKSGYTKMEFELREAGVASLGSWEVAGLEITDATGNHWHPPLFGNNTGEEIMKFTPANFMGALWSGEAAWRIKAEFSRAPNFPPEELATLAGIPVPESKGIIALNLTTNVAGGEIKLLFISGAEQEQPGNLKLSSFHDRVSLSVRADLPAEPIRRLRVVKITDDGGLAVKDLRANADANGLQATYGFIPHESARFLTVTFAVPASRFVEFLARPDFPKP